MAGGERTGVLAVIMEDFISEGAVGTEAEGDAKLSPCGVTEGTEPLLGKPVNGSSRKRETCIPPGKCGFTT